MIIDKISAAKNGYKSASLQKNGEQDEIEGRKRLKTIHEGG